jgi:hypothetical protein
VPSCLFFIGCVEQTLTVNSDPPGALVYLNDQEVGRTPLTRDFNWYGDYDVQLRLEGYETLKTHKPVTAPLWNWVPFDLVANLLPFTFRDHEEMSFTLKPLDPSKDNPTHLLARAAEMRNQLESSQYTRPPTTRPSTTRTTGPATQPSSAPSK